MIRTSHWLRGLFVCAALAGSASTVHALPPQLLAEWRLDSNPNFVWGMATIADHLDFVEIHFGPSAGFSSGPALFETVSISASSVGSSFVANAANDPDFAAVEAQLTNGSGADNVFPTTGLHGFGAAGGLHSETYWANINGSPADFAGYGLTSIELYVNAATFTSPGANPNGDGNWTSYTLDRRLRFFGTPLPDPSGASALLLLPLAGLARRARRSR